MGNYGYVVFFIGRFPSLRPGDRHLRSNAFQSHHAALVQHCLSVLPAYTPRTNPWQYSGLTGPIYWDIQANISKTFPITERFKAELKLAAYNLANRLNLADPDVVVTDAAFGQALHQNNTTAGRQLEYSLRLHF